MGIRDLQEKYPLFVIMRDNAGENKSKEMSIYCMLMEAISTYSTSYEHTKMELLNQESNPSFCWPLWPDRGWLNLSSMESIGFAQQPTGRPADMHPELERKQLLTLMGFCILQDEKRVEVWMQRVDVLEHGAARERENRA